MYKVNGEVYQNYDLNMFINLNQFFFSIFQGKTWTMKNISSCVLFIFPLLRWPHVFEIHVEELHP